MTAVGNTRIMPPAGLQPIKLTRQRQNLKLALLQDNVSTSGGKTSKPVIYHSQDFSAAKL